MVSVGRPAVRGCINVGVVFGWTVVHHTGEHKLLDVSGLSSL